jgi:hypothetical protein
MPSYMLVTLILRCLCAAVHVGKSDFGGKEADARHVM